MPYKSRTTNYLIVAWGNLSGWVEASPLVKLSASHAAKLLLESWVCRFVVSIKTVTVDNDTEFKEEFFEAVKKTGAILTFPTPCYPEANGMTEHGHWPIRLDTLVKICGESGGKWHEYFPLVYPLTGFQQRGPQHLPLMS
jgi:hypothetical protein